MSGFCLYLFLFLNLIVCGIEFVTLLFNQWLFFTFFLHPFFHSLRLLLNFLIVHLLLIYFNNTNPFS
jgi:hypothetical protein